MFLIFLPALRNPPGPPCEAAQLVFVVDAFFLVSFGSLARLSVGWSLLATGRTVTLWLTGQRLPSCLLVLRSISVQFSWWWISVAFRSVIYCSSMWTIDNYLNWEIVFSALGSSFKVTWNWIFLRLFPIRYHKITEKNASESSSLKLKNNSELAGPIFFAVFPANQILRRIRRIW